MLDSEDVKPLLNDFNRNLYATKTVFKRYLYNKINWNARLIGIKGARGVGKTTLMLQYIKENFKKLRCIGTDVPSFGVISDLENTMQAHNVFLEGNDMSLYHL